MADTDTNTAATPEPVPPTGAAGAAGAADGALRARPLSPCASGAGTTRAVSSPTT